MSTPLLESVSGVSDVVPFSAGAPLYAYTIQVDPAVPSAFSSDAGAVAGDLTMAATTLRCSPW